MGTPIFDEFQWLSISLAIFKSIFDEKNDLTIGTPYTFDEGMSCHSTKIELFILMIISVP